MHRSVAVPHPGGRCFDGRKLSKPPPGRSLIGVLRTITATASDSRDARKSISGFPAFLSALRVDQREGGVPSIQFRGDVSSALGLGMRGYERPAPLITRFAVEHGALPASACSLPVPRITTNEQVFFIPGATLQSRSLLQISYSPPLAPDQAQTPCQAPTRLRYTTTRCTEVVREGTAFSRPPCQDGHRETRIPLCSQQIAWCVVLQCT